MPFLSLADANTAELDRRMETVYNNVNTQLSRPEHLASMNSDAKNQHLDVSFGGALDEPFKERIVSELEAAGWHRIMFLPVAGSRDVFNIRLHKDAEAYDPSAQGRKANEPVADEAAEEKAVSDETTEPANDTTHADSATEADAHASNPPAATQPADTPDAQANAQAADTSKQ